MPRTLVGVFYDDGGYLALAKSLAEGHGYRLLYLPGAPVSVHYPPLYPLLLAALWKLGPAFPASVTLFRAANAVLVGLFVCLATVYLAERVTGRRWVGALVIGASAIAIPLVAVATVLFAEPLFLVLAVLACWAADAARDAEGRGELPLAVTAGALAGLTILARTIGVAVAGGVVLALLVRRKVRAAVLAALPAGLCTATWFAWVAAHRSAVDSATAANYGGYGDLLTQSGLGWLSLGSLLDLSRPLAAMTIPRLPGALGLLAAAPALVVLAAGLVELARRAPATGYALACYVFIVAVWPYPADRFLAAVLPWLALAFTAGVRGVLEHARRATGWRRAVHRTLGVAGAAIVLAGYVSYQVRGFFHGAATAEQRGISRMFEEVVPWIREATDSTAVIAGEDEALLWLYTGRRAVPSYLWRARGRSDESLGPDSLRAYFDRSGVTHVILTGPGSDAAPTIDAMLGRYPGYLRTVRVWPGPMIAFRVTRGG